MEQWVSIPFFLKQLVCRSEPQDGFLHQLLLDALSCGISYHGFWRYGVGGHSCSHRRTTALLHSLFHLRHMCVLVGQSCSTLCNPMHCSPPGSSVHGILQQEYWSGLPFPSPEDPPDPGIKLGSSLHHRQALHHRATREACLWHCYVYAIFLEKP